MIRLSLNEDEKYNKIEFDSEEFEFLVELLNKNNLAELSKKILEGQLYIIEFNEAEISASGLISYERDDALLHGKIPNFEIRLLKNKFMLTPEKIYEADKGARKRSGNISRETIEKFKESLNALVEGAWKNEDPRKANQIDRIAQKYGEK